MFFLKKTSLRKRLNIGFYSLAFIFVIIFVIISYATHQVIDLTEDITKTRFPSAQSSANMSEGVSHALSALNSWILIEDNKYKVERIKAWNEKINSELINLQYLSEKWVEPKNKERLQQLKRLLPKLQQHQIEIEEIAHTSDDIPLLSILNNEVLPIADKILNNLTQILNLEVGRKNNSSHKNLLLVFANTRNSIGLLMSSLRGFLLTNNSNDLKGYNFHKQLSKNKINGLDTVEFKITLSQRILLDEIINSRITLISLSDKIIDMRQKPDWKLSNYWLATKVTPVANKVNILLNEMKLSHQKLLHYDALQIKKNTEQELVFGWVLLIFALLFAFYMSSLIVKGIMKDVGGEPELIKNMANQLAQGDLAFEQYRGNNIKKSTGIYSSLKKIADSMKKIEFHADKVSRGDFGYAIPVRGEKDTLAVVINRMTENLNTIAGAMQRVSTGDLTVKLIPNSINDKVSMSINTMVDQLNSNYNENEHQHWTQMGRVLINDALLGGSTIKVLSDNLLVNLCVYLDASVATLYRWNDSSNGDHLLELSASYAVGEQHHLPKNIQLTEGLVGQAAKSKELKQIRNLPNDYLPVISSLGLQPLSELILFPFSFDDEIRGVIELGFTKRVKKKIIDFLKLVSADIGIAFENARINLKLNSALELSQQTTEELSVQKLELEEQQQELQYSNRELSQKTLVLSQQKEALENYARDIQIKAKELKETSKYKSEFLANMSHELRTPLNSLLILSKLLSENEEGNLTEEDIESATVINECGEQLLKLISEILDLSKIEAGKMTVFKTMLVLDSLSNGLSRYFAHMAKEKGLDFSVSIDSNVPTQFLSDDAKVNQILTNLISNAIKFTEHGSVSVKVSLKNMIKNNDSILSEQVNGLMFSVTDTGIGISSDKHESIFGAFQQANGSTNRTHGGTGLGLSISKSFAEVLGGYITVESELGIGSTFTLVLPEQPPQDFDKMLKDEVKESCSPEINNEPDKKIERFREKNINLHHVSRKKSLLIIEDNEDSRRSLEKLLISEVEILESVKSGKEALVSIQDNNYDIIVLDLYLSDMTGFELLNKLSESTKLLPPIIIHTGKELNNDELIELEQYADNIIVKSIAAPERLVTNVRDIINGKPKKTLTENNVIEINEKIEEKLLNKCNVILVDDDMRNTFSLAKALRSRGLTVHIAPSGEKALNILTRESNIDLVLMDVMMPNMDGFETIKQIRQLKNYEDLPVIAVTAKAMPGDKKACLDAKANDYLTKPVNVKKLIDMMSFWLGKN